MRDYMKKCFYTLLVYLFMIQFLTAQNDSLVAQEIVVTDSIQNESKWNRFKYDATSMGRGFVHAYARPLDWKKQDYLILGATAIGTGILFATDEQTSPYFVERGEDIPQGIQDFGFYFGKPLVNYGLTGSIYFYGLLANNEKARYTGVLLITSASVGGLLQQVLKTVTGRARPSTDLGSHYFKPFDGSAEFSSFPSGHTVLAVTTVYAISKQFKSPWVKGGLFLVGSITPLSRLWAGAHWASDVLLSAVMSVAIVESVDAYLKKEKRYQLNPNTFIPKKISWNLRAGYNQIGLVGTF